MFGLSGSKLLHPALVQNVAEMDECVTALSLYSLYGRLALCQCVCVSVHTDSINLPRGTPSLGEIKTSLKNVNTLWSGEQGSCTCTHIHLEKYNPKVKVKRYTLSRLTFPLDPPSCRWICSGVWVLKHVPCDKKKKLWECTEGWSCRNVVLHAHADTKVGI